MNIYEPSSRKNAWRNPIAGIAFALGNKRLMHQSVILNSAAYLFGSNYNKQEWLSALKEIEEETYIPPTENRDNIAVGNNLNTTFGKWMYCCIRVLKPESMIETGVAHGASSWIILNAMHKNGKGRLYSIDLPDHDTHAGYNFKTKPKTGWLVPVQLKSNWELHLGDAKILLPEILNKLGSVDIFFHDSDHSYEHMKFEFETVFPFINDGLILSDDVHKNKAFGEFVQKQHLKALQFNKGGAAKKI